MISQNARNANSGPLSGVKVVDFGWYYAGPITGVMMADQGAEVIHVIKPGTADPQCAQFRLLNRNKKVLELDLKVSADLDYALQLVANADVLIENFRPGVMKRLGLGYKAIKKINSNLIYLSLPGFPSSDKEQSKLQAWEGIISAAVGLYTAPSWWRSLLHYPPVDYWMPQCSVYGAMHGLVAVLSALIKREEYEEGVYIEVPLMNAALSGLALALPQNPEAESPIPKHFTHLKYSASDDKCDRFIKHHKAMSAVTDTPFTTFYTCADGRIVHVNCSYNRKFIKKFLTALDLYKEMLKKGYTIESPLIFGIDNDMAHHDKMEAKKAKYLRDRIAKAISRKTAKEWEDLLGETLTLSMVRTKEEWLAEPALRASGVFSTMNDGITELTVPGPIADVSKPDDSQCFTVASEPEWIDKIGALELFSSFSSKIERSIKSSVSWKKGDLLQDLKVLDLCNVVAGPASTYNLAQYGAQVIKADPPSDTHFYPAQLEFMEITQGKRSIITDLKNAPGREVFNRLIQWADVVVHNSLDNVAYKLGITPAQLQKIKPGIMSCQLSAFGGARRGGWEIRPGNDSIVQAPNGMMSHYGSLEDPQNVGGFAATDMMGGLSLSITILLTVWQKVNTGFAGEGKTSLARAVNYTQYPYMVAESDQCDWGASRGQFAVGVHWWQRIYTCSDGWIYVDSRYEKAVKFAEIVAGQSEPEENRLEEAFLNQNTEYWLALLSEAGIAAHRVMKLDEIARRAADISNNNAQDISAYDSNSLLVRRVEHPRGKPHINMNPQWVRIGEDQSYRRLEVGPKAGEDTISILSELGYDNAAIATLIKEGICYEYLPALGDKDLYCFKDEQMK